MSVFAVIAAFLKKPLFGMFAAKAAKEIARRVMDGNGTETEIRKSQTDLAIIEAAGTVHQRGIRPMLSVLSAFIIFKFSVYTFVGIIAEYGFGVVGGFGWLVLWSPIAGAVFVPAHLFGFAVLFTTGYAGFRSWEKRNGKADHDSEADKYQEAVSRAKDRTAKSDVIRRSEDIVVFPHEFVPPSAQPQLKEKAMQFLRRYEGVKYEVYKDTKGNPTFGIGHLITPDDEEYGKPVETPVSPSRVDSVFRIDIDTAMVAAGSIFKNIDELPQNAKLVLISMCFQLGADGVRGFSNFIQAVNDRNWKAAKAHGLDSKWFREDTPERAQDHMDKLAELASQ